MKTLLSTSIALCILFTASPAHAMSHTWPEWVGWPSWLGGGGGESVTSTTYGPSEESDTYNFWKHYIDVMYGEQDSYNYPVPKMTTSNGYSPPMVDMPMQDAPNAWPEWIDEPGWMYYE